MESHEERSEAALLHTVWTSDINSGSSECTSMQLQFADRCCYEPPEIPCTLCADRTIQKEHNVDFNGETVTCDIVQHSFLVPCLLNGQEDVILN